jgi:hypothetical protein
MSVANPALGSTSTQSLTASVDLDTEPEKVFTLLCSVEKWPVWLPFLRSARRVESAEPFGLGSDVVLRSEISEEPEELYEVDQFLTNHHLSLVGAYSVRRRFEFRVERKSSCSRLQVRLCCPSYHGRLVSLLNGWRRGRKLQPQLEHAMANFKSLVEYRRDDAALADL